ncbi:MAG: dimethylsulfonioproprionate lyase family protein [Pseudomonadota bacterium]
MNAAWTDLLAEARALHDSAPALAEFCPFPDVTPVDDIDPKPDPLCDTFRRDDTLTGPYAAFQTACAQTAPHALWRDTYRDTEIGDVLHAHFGTFEVLGRDTPLKAHGMRSFLIYQRPDYHYPLHHHPAEEIYLILAGEADFEVDGEQTQHLGPGDTQFHPSNVAHALTTTDRSILAYVLWRGDITTKPVFTHPQALP